MPSNEIESVLVGTNVSEQIDGTNQTDLVVGLSGDDTINTQGGDDVVHGDFESSNLLTGTETATSIAQFGETGAWTLSDQADGYTSMTQTIETHAGETYSVSFDLSANYGAGLTSGAVDVLWNNEIIGSFNTESGSFFERDGLLYRRRRWWRFDIPINRTCAINRSRYQY